MNPTLKLTGLCLVGVVLPVIVRLIWEVTWLAWSEGPQSSGLTLLSQFPLGLLFATLCWIALFIWLAIVAFLWFRQRRSFSSLDQLILGLAIATLILPLIRQPLWASATEHLLGLSPKAPDYLVSAAQRGNAKEVLRLLNRGVSANSKDVEGCAAVAAAAATGEPFLVDLLLSRQGDPNSSCSGEPAILRATRAADLATVQLLTSAGANLNARSRDGSTAYKTAIQAKHPEIAQFLAAHGGQ